MSERSIRRMRRRRLERSERGRRIGSKLGLAGGTALGATVLFAPGAHADTFTVTNLDDAGAGSLRDAIEDANLAAGADVVTFQSGLSGQITLTTGRLEIQDALDIQGPGADVIEVNGDDADRIFYVFPSVNGAAYDDVRIAGLTLSEGSTTDGGAAVYSDQATLTLEDLVVSDNYAADYGGALYSDRGKLSIIGSSFTGNVADTGAGGAVYVDDTENSTADDVEITIADSSFVGNESTTGDGGAVDLDSQGSVVIERTTITGNSAGSGAALQFGDNGGGLQVGESAGDLTISDSTFSDNAAFYGGGIYTKDVEGETLIENTTISGNEAVYDGGGIYFGYLYDDQETTIRNSTIVDNVAGANPGDYDGPYGGGGVYLYDDSEDTTDPIAENGPVAISSTIVANNTVEGPSVEGPDLGSGEFSDGFIVGNSLIEDTSGAEISNDPAGSNITGTDPELGALAANGGPTETHLPALTSPALDAGIANGLSSDQRGSPRTFDAVVIANASGSDGTDIGATELQPGENDLPGNASCQGAVVGSKTGTEANDTITGTEAPDALFGAGGDDNLSGLGANDCLNGDAGKDTANGGPGKDLVKGQAGRDKLKGAGGKDKLKGAGGKDKANGGGGKDKISGGAGKDKLSGKGGKDKLKGNGGSDRLKAADGKRDKVNCGGGNDKATVDAKDKVSNNCETVKVTGG